MTVLQFDVHMHGDKVCLPRLCLLSLMACSVSSPHSALQDTYVVVKVCLHANVG
jgi:hypothetical protein